MGAGTDMPVPLCAQIDRGGSVFPSTSISTGLEDGSNGGENMGLVPGLRLERALEHSTLEASPGSRIPSAMDIYNHLQTLRSTLDVPVENLASNSSESFCRHAQSLTKLYGLTKGSPGLLKVLRLHALSLQIAIGHYRIAGRRLHE